MKRAALALVLVALAPAAASAGGSGGFVSLGVGTTANTGGDLGNVHGGGVAGSLFAGQRFGMFGVEAGLSKFSYANDNNRTWDVVGLAAAGRLTVPIGPMFGAYLRLGIEKTWNDATGNDPAQDYSGTGWLAGIGGEYKLNLGFAQGAVFAELTRHDQSFVNDVRERSGHLDVISAGISVGF